MKKNKLFRIGNTLKLLRSCGEIIKLILELIKLLKN